MDAVEYVFDYDSFATSRQSVKSLLKSRNDVLKRNWCAYTFVIMLGLRVCPYCNEQYIAPILTHKGRVRADLDHFFSKKKYPFFALSIYNLIPCCKFCNSSLKGEKIFIIKIHLPRIKFRMMIISHLMQIKMEKSSLLKLFLKINSINVKKFYQCFLSKNDINII